MVIAPMRALRFVRATVLIIAGLVAANGHAHAGETPRAGSAASRPPLFSAFLRFCYDTDARPDAVKAAVEAAGGTLERAPISTTWPGRATMTGTDWDYTEDGERLTVQAGSVHFFRGASRRVLDSNDCVLTRYTDDAASVSAVRDWVGVPPYNDFDSVTSYYFLKLGSKRISALGKGEEVREAKVKDGGWLLNVFHSHHIVSIQLDHDLPTRLPEY